MRAALLLTLAITSVFCATAASPPAEQALTLTSAGAQIAAIIRSIPLQHTVATLQRLAREASRPITTHVLPGLDHGLRHVVTGERPDYWRAIAEWLQQQQVLPR